MSRRAGLGGRQSGASTTIAATSRCPPARHTALLDRSVARERAVGMRTLHHPHIPAWMVLLPMGGLAHRHARADIRIRQVGMLRRALTFRLIVDLHELVTARPIIELDAALGKAIHVERPLIGERAANHEDEGGWRHGRQL